MPDPNPSLIEAARCRPWFRLALPGTLEARFTETTRTSSGAYLQSWLLVFLVFNVLSLKLDFDVFGPERFAVPALLTLGVFVPVGLIAIIALHGTPTATRQATVVTVTALVDMIVVLNSAEIAPPIHADTYRILAVIVPLVVGMIAPLSFRHCLVFCGSAFVLYVGYVIGFVLPQNEPTGLPLLIASLVLVPLKLAYSREWTSKETFLLTLEKARRDADLADANARLTILSETDPLTGLANRRAATAALQAGWARARDAGGWAAVALIDIDNFKRLNDSAGHLEGDRCLQCVADALKIVAEASGAHVARYGGEEFIVHMPGAEPDTARAIGERLRAAVADMAYPHPDLPIRDLPIGDLPIGDLPAGVLPAGNAPRRGRPDEGSPAGAYVTVSVGVAAAHGGVGALGIGASDLLKSADDALYRAKRGGRNRVEALSLTPDPANSDQRPPIKRAGGASPRDIPAASSRSGP
ncbi:GGDEF domain-containing protein [Methylobacterium sp. J-068]|uniref:GGDEF domain-containing protein n=1 Tax=Methylobacterium sp. J-068 TaxID=2836649 RepID=UPI001FBA786A|nr:GGDEF domain-containing protein [Methylobacterium sp. J-068]MCJ2033517.1 GGDEF domain-containing protein [Methylobacterium sp. J-068]